MRKAWAAAGAGVLGVGVVLAALGLFEQMQAEAAVTTCFGGPVYGYPATCADAMSALYLWETVTSLAVTAGVAGFIILLLGLILQPEGVRLGPPYAPQYPPPLYAPSYPPPVYGPPQEPKSPPPGGP